MNKKTSKKETLLLAGIKRSFDKGKVKEVTGDKANKFLDEVLEDATSSPAVEGNCEKKSVSLYPFDLKKLDEIIDYVYSKSRVRVTRSEAVKIAIRSVKMSDEVFKVLEAIRLQDKRGTR